MSDVQLYTKLSSLPSSLKGEVADFIDFLIYKSKQKKNKVTPRMAGKAKGLIVMKSDFDDPLPGFEDYTK
ncbi:type II toxin-antitoxin system VapB family antitoxin [Parapedobacter sp.]